MAIVAFSASFSDVGKVRRINEDSCLELTPFGLWAVADGMGGHSAGDVASQAIVNELARVEGHSSLSSYIEDVENRLLGVDNYLQELARSRELVGAVIGSTVVVLLAMRSQAACLWAGDSRIYRSRDGELRCLTQDHSEVAKLVAHGYLSEEQAANHPAGNVITRAIGALEDSESVEVKVIDVRAGDRFLLCSDGLYRELSSEELRGALSAGSVADACNELRQLASTRTCTDNLTGVVVAFEDPANLRLAIPGI